MYGDTGTTTQAGFGAAFLQRPAPDDAAPQPHGARVLLWIGLAAASWAAVILAGYCIWSAL
ncbi:MAG TPA: hypothetical protein VH722_08165 [Alphaproteobacteria bacterium]|jgi:hypothetical protein|nr:hypothetical protein [Alphaproteobacteria bacterium]